MYSEGYEPLDHASSRSVWTRIVNTPRAVLVSVGFLVVLLVIVGVNESSTTSVSSTGAEMPAAVHIQTLDEARDKKEDAADERKDSPIYRVTGDLKESLRFFHISDTHVDPFFDPSMTMQDNVCHSCQFSTKVHGDEVFCPTTLPETFGGESNLIDKGYAFGRYMCNPPQHLLHSLLKHLQSQDPNPKFIIFTGDIAPHGYPGDGYKLDKNTKLNDLCPTKFLIFRQNIRALVAAFPKTRFAFSMGNNDHLPKNTFWAPYMRKLGDMFLEEGFMDKHQHATFVETGSHSFDVDGIRFLCPDLTLFTPGGETSFVDEEELKGLEGDEREMKKYPVRTKTLKWLHKQLKDAEKHGLAVYLVGHQPLTSKKGKDELDVEGVHFGSFKNMLSVYKDTIKVAFFGHRNLAGLSEVLGPLGKPQIPSITVPGVSPRGKNQPCYNTVYAHPKTKVIQEFEQWTFNLMDENEKAKSKPSGYLGEWKQHANDVYSWRALSGEDEFTADSLSRVLTAIPKKSRDFFAIEVWKRSGYIGDETPENYRCKALYDTNDGMMRCLFSNQDERCWSTGWLA